MVSRKEFDAFCGSLAATTNVVQWGGASVWKVGGKIFAVCSNWGKGAEQRISFKCSDLAYEILTDQPGIVPAPYLARAKWVQIENPGAMTRQDLLGHIETAHDIIARKLTKAQRKDLKLA